MATEQDTARQEGQPQTAGRSGPVDPMVIPQVRTGVDLFGRSAADRVIERIRTFQPMDGTRYRLGFSGGKDSVVLYDCAVRSGVPFDPVFCVTLEPPELLRFVRTHYPEVVWERSSKGGVFSLIPRKALPTRRRRWCCELTKEASNAPGSRVLVGVRWQESSGRSKRKMVEQWRTGATVVNPMLDLSTTDVWNYIKAARLPYCSLYDEGWKRLGCVGCPMGRQDRRAQFARWTRYKRAWQTACRRRWERHPPTQAKWPSWQEYWEWWLSDEGAQNDADGQCSLFG